MGNKKMLKDNKFMTDELSGDATLFEGMDFIELEERFGLDNARAILRMLEQFEGIAEPYVADLSDTDRMRNVMSVMKDNNRYQTRH
jgi:hypothetical protein